MIHLDENGDEKNGSLEDDAIETGIEDPIDHAELYVIAMSHHDSAALPDALNVGSGASAAQCQDEGSSKTASSAPIRFAQDIKPPALFWRTK